MNGFEKTTRVAAEPVCGEGLFRCPPGTDPAVVRNRIRIYLGDGWDWSMADSVALVGDGTRWVTKEGYVIRQSPIGWSFHAPPDRWVCSPNVTSASGPVPIGRHEGRKYLREIRPADGAGSPILVDVYSVLVAFGVTCPATAHAIKKLLCPGLRGKGSATDDLLGAMAALSRAMELRRDREATPDKSTDTVHETGRSHKLDPRD